MVLPEQYVVGLPQHSQAVVSRRLTVVQLSEQGQLGLPEQERQALRRQQGRQEQRLAEAVLSQHRVAGALSRLVVVDPS